MRSTGIGLLIELAYRAPGMQKSKEDEWDSTTLISTSLPELSYCAWGGFTLSKCFYCLGISTVEQLKSSEIGNLDGHSVTNSKIFASQSCHTQERDLPHGLHVTKGQGTCAMGMWGQALCACAGNFKPGRLEVGYDTAKGGMLPRKGETLIMLWWCTTLVQEGEIKASGRITITLPDFFCFCFCIFVVIVVGGLVPVIL